MSNAVAAIKSEIARKQAEIDALKKALAALGGSAPSAGRGNRKPRSEAQKRKISAALKKAWAERKKAEKKAAG
jgi:endonuclease/exonuclease/phosphatase (EEP) superfamily protein YafD